MTQQAQNPQKLEASPRISYDWLDSFIGQIMLDWQANQESVKYGSLIVEYSKSLTLYFLHHKSVRILEIYSVPPTLNIYCGESPTSFDSDFYLSFDTKAFFIPPDCKPEAH